jgi:hypothetical protein
MRERLERSLHRRAKELGLEVVKKVEEGEPEPPVLSG